MDSRNIDGLGCPWPAFIAGCEAMSPPKQEELLIGGVEVAKMTPSTGKGQGAEMVIGTGWEFVEKKSLAYCVHNFVPRERGRSLTNHSLDCENEHATIQGTVLKQIRTRLDRDFVCKSSNRPDKVGEMNGMES